MYRSPIRWLSQNNKPNLSIRRTVGSRFFYNDELGVSGSTANLCGIILFTFYRNERDNNFQETQVFNTSNTIALSNQKISDVMGDE